MSSGQKEVTRDRLLLGFINQEAARIGYGQIVIEFTGIGISNALLRAETR
jgi:hypothetical protein